MWSICALRKKGLFHMAKTKINCLNCNEDVWVENKEIARGFGKFCSRKCSAKHRVNNLTPLEPNVKCALCKKDFYLCESKQDASKSGLYFCCRKHKDAAQRIGGIKEIMPAHYGTITKTDDSGHYRKIAFSKKPKICERCGYHENEAAIIVHHKDRNRMNDSEDNLEVLCCNCHAIEHWSES